MTRIVLHIEKLVLRGIDRQDAKAVSAGVRAELQRLLGEPDTANALRSNSNRFRISTAPAKIPAGSDASGIGTRVGASIASGVKP